MVGRYASASLQERVKIWARLICLQPILKAIDQHIPTTSGRLIDLGCGHGLVSLLVASRRRQTILGIEMSPSRFAIAKKAAHDLSHVTFQHGDIAQMRIPLGDAILLIDVLFLFSDETQQRILANCAHALTPKGVVLVKDNTTIPGWKCCYATFEEKIKRSIRAYGVTTRSRPNYHASHRWRQLIRRANLKICNEFLIESIAPYPGIIYVCQKC